MIYLEKTCRVTMVHKNTTWKAFEDLNVGDLMHFSIKLSHTASGSCGRKQAYVICKNLKTGVESKYTLNQIERPMANYEWEELK